MNEFVKEKDEASPEGDESTFNMRVRSWLRMNAGGVPNTCKSNGVLKECGFGQMTFELSGGRVSNA